MGIVVAAFNFLNDPHAVKWNTHQGLENGQSNWLLGRRERVMETIKNANAHVVCLQEVNPQFYPELKERARVIGYEITELSLCKAGDSEPEGEKIGVCMLYNSSRVKLLQQHIYQSLEGYTPWTRGETLADYEDLVTGKTLRVASVHLRGYGRFEPDDETKLKFSATGYKEICDVVRMVETYPEVQPIDMRIIAGDFNEDPYQMHNDKRVADPDTFAHSRHAVLLNNGYVTDGNTSPSEIAFEKDGTTLSKPDYIYVKGSGIGLEPVDIEQAPQTSDHMIVATRIYRT